MESSSIQSYLSPGETLFWSGAPAKKYRFERKHLLILFFIVPFFVFMMIPIAGIFSTDKPQPAQTEVTLAQTNSPSQPDAPKPPKHEPLFVRIFLGIFILCFFLAMASGIFVAVASQMGGSAMFQSTECGITNQRLIIVFGKKNKIVQSVHLGTVTDIRMKEWPDGLGTITFGPDLAWPYAGSIRASTVALGNIPNPRDVFQVIIQARKNA